MIVIRIKRELVLKGQNLENPRENLRGIQQSLCDHFYKDFEQILAKGVADIFE